MGQPITWRNVEAPSFDGASRALAAAQVGVNSGFDKFGEVIKQQQAVENANWDQQKLNNTEAFYNQMAQYKTPEEFQAAVDAGVLRDSLKGYGAQIDQAAARRALDSQMGVLQDRLTKAQSFAENQTKFGEKEGRDAVTALIAAGKTEEGMAKARELGLHDLAPLQELAVKTARANATYEQDSKLKTIQYDNAIRTEKDAENLRTLQADLAGATSKYFRERDVTGKKLGELASLNGFPVSATSGMPRYDLMTEREIAAMDHLAKTKGISFSGWAQGDTQAADAYVGALEKSGKYTPEFLERNLASIRGAWDSTKNQGTIGNDALEVNRASARNRVAQERIDKGNVLYSPGSPNVQTEYEDLIKQVEGMQDLHPVNRQDIRRALSTIMLNGIPTADGQRVIPSAQQAMAAIRTTTDGVGFDWLRGVKDHGENVYLKLKQDLTRKNIQAMLKAGQESETYWDNQKVKERLGTNK